MARRHQNPTPKKSGNYWYIFVYEDVLVDGQFGRKLKRVRIGPATLNFRQAQKEAEEYLRPINQGLDGGRGGAIRFADFVKLYESVVLPLQAKPTQVRSKGIIKNYLVPAFGGRCLRELHYEMLQSYFSGMVSDKKLKELSRESQDKIRDVLSSIMGAAKRFGRIAINPAEEIMLPPSPVGRRVAKPNITSEQFSQLVELMPEPYATMVYVAVYSGLRVSELIGLRWNDVGPDCLMVDERCCRGDWSAPKSESSNAPVAVQRHVIERIHALKLKTAHVKAGRAVRKYKLVKSAEPGDLVFQSVRSGKPMRDNNILSRFIKPAARAIGLGFINWRCLRTSYGTWLKRHGADMKDIQGQMRHSRMSTTADIYVQDIPESRRNAVERLPLVQ